MQRDVRTPREKVPPPRPAFEPLLLCSRAAPFFAAFHSLFTSHLPRRGSLTLHLLSSVLCGSCIQAFGALSPRSVSPSQSVLSLPRSPRLSSRHNALRLGRDVAPCTPHTISVYKRPRNDEQLPRWLKHRTADNWNLPSYLYSPGMTGKCHFYLDSKFHWKPPVDTRDEHRERIMSRGVTRSPLGFKLPPHSPLASAPSSPRLSTALVLSRKNSLEERSGTDSWGAGGRKRLVIRSP